MTAETVGLEDKAATEDALLGAAGSFTGLWALTWLGATAVGAGAAVQGGFAIGGVMAGSGLTMLWWKTRFLRNLAEENGETMEDDLRLIGAPEDHEDA